MNTVNLKPRSRFGAALEAHPQQEVLENYFPTVPEWLLGQLNCNRCGLIIRDEPMVIIEDRKIAFHEHCVTYYPQEDASTTASSNQK